MTHQMLTLKPTFKNIVEFINFGEGMQPFPEIHFEE